VKVKPQDSALHNILSNCMTSPFAPQYPTLQSNTNIPTIPEERYPKRLGNGYSQTGLPQEQSGMEVLEYISDFLMDKRTQRPF
jgi:hypothetical protein